MVIDSNGCQASTSNIQITADSNAFTYFMDPSASCAGSSNGKATVVVGNGTPVYTYLWSDPLAQATAMAINLSGGSYTVTITDALGCIGSTSVTISEGPPMTTSTTSGQATIGSEDGWGTVVAEGGVEPYSYSWDDFSFQTTQTATDLGEGTYIVSVTDANDCNDTSSVIITVAVIVSTEGFTPNGDGVNDTWFIGDMSLYPDVEVTIFGRWGAQIFKSIGYEEPWDGTYQGQPLPMSSYYYIIDLHEGSKPVTGAVTILK